MSEAKNSSDLDAKALLDLDKPKIHAILKEVYDHIPPDRKRFTEWVFDTKADSPREVRGNKGFFTKAFKELKCDYENELSRRTLAKMKGPVKMSKAQAELEAKVELIADRTAYMMAETYMDSYTEKYWAFKAIGEITDTMGG